MPAKQSGPDKLARSAQRFFRGLVGSLTIGGVECSRRAKAHVSSCGTSERFFVRPGAPTPGISLPPRVQSHRRVAVRNAVVKFRPVVRRLTRPVWPPARSRQRVSGGGQLRPPFACGPGISSADLRSFTCSGVPRRAGCAKGRAHPHDGAGLFHHFRRNPRPVRLGDHPREALQHRVLDIAPPLPDQGVHRASPCR